MKRNEIVRKNRHGKSEWNTIITQMFLYKFYLATIKTIRKYLEFFLLFNPRDCYEILKNNLTFILQYVISLTH